MATFAIGSDGSVDVAELAAGTIAPGGVPCGELLEGLAFEDSPALETWRGAERLRLAADCRALTKGRG